MTRMYEEGHIKALATMISRGDFNPEKEISYKWWGGVNKKPELNDFLNNINFNQTLKIDQLEVDMLSGVYTNLPLENYLKGHPSASKGEITAIDLLLHTSISNEDLFNRFLQINTDFSKIKLTLNTLLVKYNSNKNLQMLEKLLDKGASLNSKDIWVNYSISEIFLISLICRISELSLMKYKLEEAIDIKQISKFFFKYKEHISLESNSEVYDTFERNYEYMKEYCILDLELKNETILDRIEEYIEKVTDFYLHEQKNHK